MFIFSILAVFLVTIHIAKRTERSFTEMLPPVTGVFILILYFLAFFRSLYLVDFLAAGLLLGAIFYFVKRRIPDLKGIMPELSRGLAVFFLLFLLTLSQIPKIATWWDDINFWATDAKALYFLGGFAGKYGNVAPEFGDYPPGIQLFKWFFLHMNSRNYTEGLAFSGYQCLNLIFLLPLVPKWKGGFWKGFLITLLSGILLILFPTVVSVVCFQGACADVTMGIIYGGLLYAVWERREGRGGFIRIAIYGSILVLTKSVGIEWAAFAFLFDLIISRGRKKEPFFIKERLLAWGGVLLIWLSWILFCLMNRRVSKLTSAGVRMASSGVRSFIGYAGEKAGYFLRGFAFEPMHTDHTMFFDLSALMMFVLILISAGLLYRLGKLQKGMCSRLIVFCCLTAFAAYSIIFLGHITIFAMETQYASSEVMAISISRYGAPFTLGMMYLIMKILTEGSKEDRVHQQLWCLPGCVLFVLLTCDPRAVYQGLWGYRDSLASDLETRQAMIEEEAIPFIETISSHQELMGKRVLYLQDTDSAHWVHNAYLNLEVSPVAVVYGNHDVDTTEKDVIIGLMDLNHASCVYADGSGTEGLFWAGDDGNH